MNKACLNALQKSYTIARRLTPRRKPRRPCLCVRRTKRLLSRRVALCVSAAHKGRQRQGHPFHNLSEYAVQMDKPQDIALYGGCGNGRKNQQYNSSKGWILNAELLEKRRNKLRDSVHVQSVFLINVYDVVRRLPQKAPSHVPIILRGPCCRPQVPCGIRCARRQVLPSFLF